jgi:hypothetical protein
MIEVMEIVAIQNDEIYPPKEKYNVCIYPDWYFVINSNDRKIYRPNLKIQQAGYPFLRQDSYICCSRVFAYDAINTYRKLGVLSKQTAQEIIETVDSVRTLTSEQIDCIKSSLINKVSQLS